ncbi:flippase-like domain-containing protein [Anaerolineae bacterium CFX9]|nr:flippase-like domain-containing protein [Anaerolineae bacterium CFX9]
MNSLKNWRIWGLGAAGTLIAVFFIVRGMGDLSQLGDAFRQARWIYLIPAFLLVGIGLAARAVRWRVLLSDGLPFNRAFHILNVSYLVNGILPFRIGEVARAFLATRADPPVPIFKSASTIVVERLLDLLAVLVILALSLAFSNADLPDEIRGAALAFAPIAIAGFIALVIAAGQRQWVLRVMNALTTRVELFRRLRLDAWIEHFLDGLRPLSGMRTLALTLLWTAISWAISVFAAWVTMWAFYDQADLAAVGLFVAAASFAVALPAVPGNLGTYEASIVIALAASGYGEPFSVAAALAMVIHFKNLGMNAILGVIGLISEGITVGQLTQGVREMRTEQMTTLSHAEGPSHETGA